MLSSEDLLVDEAPPPAAPAVVGGADLDLGDEDGDLEDLTADPVDEFTIEDETANDEEPCEDGEEPAEGEGEEGEKEEGEEGEEKNEEEGDGEEKPEGEEAGEDDIKAKSDDDLIDECEAEAAAAS